MIVAVVSQQTGGIEGEVFELGERIEHFRL
jgi:hypothetical protein